MPRNSRGFRGWPMAIPKAGSSTATRRTSVQRRPRRRARHQPLRGRLRERLPRTRRLILGVAERVQSRTRRTSGLRATHSARPCRITWCENRIQCSCGMIFIRSCSILHRVGVLRQIEACGDALHVRVHHHAGGDAVGRAQHHVGGLARGAGNGEHLLHGPRHLAAEFGDHLPAAPTIDLALLLKKPVLRMSCASTSGRTAAKSCGVGYLANRPGVTSLTRLSVHCAERMVATSNSQGLLWCSAQVASGYMRSRRRRISARRCLRSAAVFGRGTRGWQAEAPALHRACVRMRAPSRTLELGHAGAISSAGRDAGCVRRFARFGLSL